MRNFHKFFVDSKLISITDEGTFYVGKLITFESANRADQFSAIPYRTLFCNFKMNFALISVLFCSSTFEVHFEIAKQPK